MTCQRCGYAGAKPRFIKFPRSRHPRAIQHQYITVHEFLCFSCNRRAIKAMRARSEYLLTKELIDELDCAIKERRNHERENYDDRIIEEEAGIYA